MQSRFTGGQNSNIKLAAFARCFASEKGVFLRLQRLQSAPDIPTVDEIGYPGLLVSVWYGLWAPKGTPKDVVVRINDALRAALADPAVRKHLSELGQELPTAEQTTPAGHGAYHRAEVEKWWPIIKAANIKIE